MTAFPRTADESQHYRSGRGWSLGLRALLLLAACAWAFPSGAADEPPRRPKVGLVLSGGGALGIAHVGVLQVLRELRVPVDLVVGTSMGSIVGASFASGMSPEEQARRIAAIDWDAVRRDEPPRADQSILRKQLDVTGLWGVELGMRDGVPFLPRGAIAGQELLRVLRGFVREPPEGDFDRLSVPYRAVATDIETGRMVVLSRGDLARSMRASMSVPGVVAPEEIDGRILLDGGLVRNLPVDVARQMGAEVIIAVNLGTKLLRREDLQSVLGVSLQMINILTEQNVRRSLAELTDRDILIEPDLSGFSAVDFDKSVEIVPRGAAAARAVAARLQALSLSQEDFDALRLGQVERLLPRTPVSGIKVDTGRLSYVNPAIVDAVLRSESGAPPDEDSLGERVSRLYGRGDLARIDYRFVDKEGQRTLEVETTEKPRGPSYLRFGLKLFSDFKGDGRFSLLAFYNKTWINSLGAEWRTLAQLGHNPGISSEFYQPLDLRGWLFIAPRIQSSQRTWDIFLDNQRVAQYQVRQTGVGLDVGANFERWGELRAGVYRASASATPSTAFFGFQAVDFTIANFNVRALYDRLDNINFPTDGTYAAASVVKSSQFLGATSGYTTAQFEAAQAFGVRAHSAVLTVRGGRSLSGDLPIYDFYTLGGFLNLSGYQFGQLTGDAFTMGRLAYYYRLKRIPALVDGLFIGGSLEGGSVYEHRGTPAAAASGFVVAGSVFIAADTALGPLYLAYGRAEGGQNALYLFLGRP